MQRRLKPPTCQKREHRIAPPSMQPWHSARPYDTATGREPAPLDDVESFAEFLHELWNFEKIIAVVGIAHDDIFPSSRQNSAHQSTAVSSLSHVDQAGAELCRDSLTSVGASIVGNDNFSCYFLFI